MNDSELNGRKRYPIQSDLNFHADQISICYFVLKYFNCATFSRGLLADFMLCFVLRSGDEAFFLIRLVGGVVQLGPLGTAATDWPCTCPGWLWWSSWWNEDWQGNRSTWRKPDTSSLRPPQIPLDQTRDRTRAAAVGSQRLTAWAMARPKHVF
jgi:hypothetical protein